MRVIMKMQVFATIILLMFFENAFSQIDLRNITPLSPNAAEFSKYGETPVENFTGIPNIGIPLYTIDCGALKLPLAISYHAGGNKVESVASWVGLSWSLGSFPNITRGVNGLPDEMGYFNPYMGETAEQLATKQIESDDDRSKFQNYMAEVKQGTADSEPDIFSFSINGKSVKFYYNQTLKKFVVFPFANIQITYDNGSFTIVSDDGTKYYFAATDTESSMVQGTGPGTYVTTSWMITSIKDATETDAINFSYALEQTLTQSFSSETKYQLSGTGACMLAPDDVHNTTLLTTLRSRQLNTISFRGGVVSFVPAANEREDLFGAHALDAMQVYTSDGKLVKHFTFSYKYLTGGGPTGTFRSNKWMLLTNLKERAIDNSGAAIVHSFQYDENAVPATRYSFAQDYWGYHNGKVSNTTLIPETIITSVLGKPVWVPGADRAVNPDFTQFGILKKIVYPTGGYTEFDYESNRIIKGDAPPKYITRQVALNVNDGTTMPGEENLPVHSIYTLDFTVNHAEGAAVVNIEIGELGVPEGQGTPAAQISLRGTSSATSNIFFTISADIVGRFLPNGDYQIVAEFNQNPPMYQNFYCMVTWKEPDLSPTVDYDYAGGLRIKETRIYDGIKKEPMVKKYLYVNDLSTGACSGELCGNNNFNYSDDITISVRQDIGGSIHLCSDNYVRLKSFSNQAQVTSSGSYVGYNKVFVQSSSPEQTGYSSFTYTFEKDAVSPLIPYPPPSSNEALRGQLKEQDDYIWLNGSFQLARKVTNLYSDIISEETKIFGIKPDPNLIDAGNSNDLQQVPAYQTYELFPTWSVLKKTTEQLFDKEVTRQVENVTDYTYDFTYYQLTEVSKTSSEGKVKKTSNYYPYDLTMTGDAEAARTWLVDANKICMPLKTETSVSGVITTTNTTEYKKFDGNKLVLPASIKLQNGSGTDAKYVYYDSYNSNGSLLEQHKVNDLTYAYIWSYNQLYPVAQIMNSVSANVYYTSFEEGDGNSTENDCKTGRKSKTGGFSKTITDLANGSYIVSYWLKNGNTWVLQTNNVTVTGNSYIINLLGQVDEVRLYPSNAQMTTYTYDTLVGMTSQCDINNRVIYYEYDAFNRLKLVKDHDGNILKTIDYHYQNN